MPGGFIGSPFNSTGNQVNVVETHTYIIGCFPCSCRRGTHGIILSVYSVFVCLGHIETSVSCIRNDFSKLMVCVIRLSLRAYFKVQFLVRRMILPFLK